jgi:hypothetical protein
MTSRITKYASPCPPDKRADQIACVKPDELFHDNIPEDVRFNVKADSEEEAE